MTVTLQISTNASTAAPGATVFPFAFKIVQSADLQVTVDKVVKTLGVDYTIAGVGIDGGGSVTFLTPMVGGEKVVRKRAMSYSRSTDYQNLGDLHSSTLNNDQDGPVLMIQQLAAEVNRALQVADEDMIGGLNLQLPAPEAGKIIGWNLLNSGFRNVDISGPADLLLRSDLYDPFGGTNLLITKQAGSGAFARTQANKNLDLLNVMDFCDPAQRATVLAGTASASAAFSSAIDEALARGRGGIRIPAGEFLLDATVAKSIAGQKGFAIEGEGMGITVLVVTAASGNGLDLTTDPASGTLNGNAWLNNVGSGSPSNAIRLANFTVAATSLNIGNGIKINGNSAVGTPAPAITVDHVEVRALSSINGAAFARGFYFYDCSAVYMIGCRALCGGTTNLVPVNVEFEASASGADPTDIHLVDCNIYYGAIGVKAGEWIEGIYLTNTCIVGCSRAVQWICTAESGLHVMGGHYNSKEYNFYLTGVFEYVICGALLILQGGSSVAHIRTEAGSGWSIASNVFQAGPIGIQIISAPSGNRGCLIGPNQFNSLTTAAIALSGTTNNVNINRQGYKNCTARITGTGNTNIVVDKTTLQFTTTTTLTGGAATEDRDIALAGGYFDAKPTSAIVVAEASSAQVQVTPMWSDAATTATNLRVRFNKRDGTSLAGGAVRLHLCVAGDI